MFEDIEIGDRIAMANFRTKCFIEGVVKDISYYKAWIDLDGGITIYDDEGSGWFIQKIVKFGEKETKVRSV